MTGGPGGGHIALLGDSIFDNRAYTGREPDVIAHLRDLLPTGWQATLCAVDGATTRNMAAQVAQIPTASTDVVVSIGGNDALQNADLLTMAARSSADALTAFAERLDTFERAYGAAIDRVRARQANVTVCTIYNGALEPERARLARVGLRMFNDVIFRAAFARRLGVIELRAVCTDHADYANPIEPSGRGGRKIAEAIVRATAGRHAEADVSRVWA